MNMDSISDLLEIAGEDDSLLSDHGSTSANIFSCSPLVSIRSRPLQTTQPAEGIEITSVVSEDLTSKCSKPEAPESQQKKRKKKFGGFNLRKSLAWDRAFFTEQGVLNPTELSMISGTATPNSKSNLEVIDEEELGTTSIALQKIEENLFKHSSGGVSIREEKIGAVSGLTPKSGASVKRTPPIASLGKRKVLATNNVGNKYKGSAIPRAVPSSSIDTAKMPSKESKITRIPGPKSNVSANATTTRSGMLSSGSSKRNQIARPSLSKNPTPSITSQSKNPMPSIPRLSKNPTPSISSQSKNPTYVPSIPKVDMADKCSVSRTLTKQAGKLSDTPVSILRPQSRMDQTMHQTGTIKSSGLRKPSPSIGFFSQVKASSLQTSSIPCKPSESNIPKLRKLETVPVKEARSKIVKGAAKSRTKELSLSDVKSEVQIDNKQMAGVEVDCDSSTFEIINKQAEVENILDDAILKSKEQGELHENEIISSMENMVLPTHEKEFLTESQTHEQLEKEADHTLVKESDTKEFSLSDFKPEAIVQIDNKQMAGVEVDCDSSTFEIINKQAEVENILDDAILKSKEQGELHENEIISSMENMVLPTHEKEFLTESQTHEQLEKEADHTLEKESDTKEFSLSDFKPEAIVQIDNKQMAGVEVDCDSSTFEISKQAEVENILDDAILKPKEQGELHENEIISSMENMVLPTHEKEFLTESQTHECLLENIVDDVILKSKEQGELHENEIISSMENMVLPTHEKEFLTKSQTHEQLEKEADHTLEKESDTKEFSLSDFKPEAIVQIDNKQMAGVEVDCDSSTFEISKQAEVENILDDAILKSKEQGELHENEIISSMENMVLPTHEKEFLTKSHTHEQLEKEADHTLEKESDTKELSLSDVKPEAIMQIDNKQMAGVEVDCDSSIFEIISKQAEVESLLDDAILKSKEQGELHENEIISSPENIVLSTHEKEFLTKNQTHEQLEKEADHTLEKESDHTLEKESDHTLEKESDTKELSLSDVTPEAIMQIDNKQMAGVEVDCNSSIFEIISKKADVENILDDVVLKFKEQGELHENEIISSMENMVLPTHEKEFLTKSPTHEQLEKEADHTLDNKLYDVSSNGDRFLYQEPQSTFFPIIKRTSNTVQNAIGHEDDQIKRATGDIPTFKESLILQAEFSGEFKGYNSVKTALLNSSLDDFSKTVPKGSKQGTPCKNTEQVNYDADEFGRYEGNAQGHLLNESLTINCKKTTESNLEAVSQQLQADQPKTLNPSGVEKIGPGKENISDMNSSQPVHVTSLFSKGSPEKSILGINDASEDESKIIEIKDCQLPVYGLLGFIPRSPVDKECDQVIDSKAIHDKIPEFELNRLSENCITVSASSLADDNNINEDSRLPGFQKPSAVVAVNSQDVHLDSDFLPIVIVSSTEINDQNLVENAFEGYGFHSNEHNATNHHHIEDMPVNINGSHDVDRKVELLQINDVEDGNLDVDEKAELLQINDVEDGNHNVDEKVELLQINGADDGNHGMGEKVALLQINGAEDGNHDVDEKGELLQINGAEDGNRAVDEKVELLQINDVEDGNHDVDEKVELLQINGAEDGNCDVDEKMELLQINDVDEKVELLQINDVDEMVELLQINYVEDGNHDVDEKVELLQINGAEDGNHDVEEKVELLQINDAEEGLSDILLPLVESQLNENFFSAECDSSIEVTGDFFTTGVTLKYEKQCILSENSKLLSSDRLVNKDGNQGVDEKVELLQINGAEEGSLDISPSVEIPLENVISAEFDSSTKVSEDPCPLSEKSKLLASENSIFNATIPQGSEVSSMKLNENAISAELDSSIEVSEGSCLLSEKLKLLASENSIFNATIPQGSEVSSVKLNRNAISTELDSSIEVSEGPFTSVVAWKPEEQCLVSEKSKLLDSDNPIFIETIPQGNEVSSVNSEILSDAAVTTVFENDKSPNTDMPSKSKDNIDFPEDNSKIIHFEIDATKTKQEVPIAKPPLNVAPFTEEWLAAIEAAGEEILTMKSGAVQNSPPDKVQNEPNPWSPVKKNQEIGPFDCTKITKHNIQSSDPS